MRPNGSAFSPKEPVKILIIVPAYNEEANIPFVMEDLNEIRADVLVVNDGSTDATAEVAEGFGATVVSHPFNMGIGGTMQTGFMYAAANDYDMAVQFDGDAQHRADQIRRIIEPVGSGEADLTIGSRTIPGGYRIGVTRWFGSKIFLGMIKGLTGMRINDPTSGFRCYGRKTLQLFSRRYPDDYPEVESIITAHRSGLRVREVPVLMRPRLSGHSSITRRKSAYYMVKVSLAMLVDAMRGKSLADQK